MRALYDAALEEAADQKLKVKELQGLLAKNDDACLELAQIKSKHAEEMGASREEHKEALQRLKKEAEAEIGRLTGMLAEMVEKLNQRDHSIADMGASMQWQQEQIMKLDDELSLVRSEVADKRSRINGLKERIETVKADKLRAIDEAKEVSERLARKEEEMAKLASDNQARTQAMQAELLSSRTANAEFESQVTELEGQIALLRRQVVEAEARATSLQGQLTEVETRLAMLKGEQDATCSEAYALGEEECRKAISEVHPEWDLSFLDAKTPIEISADEEEDEYVDDSDADHDAAMRPGEVTVPEGCPPTVPGGAGTFEKGESSRASEGAAGDLAGADPTSEP